MSRIGTTGAEVINLEDCSGCGLSNWGWQDNGWGVGVLGPLIYFQNSGAAYDPDPLPGRWLVAGSVGAVTNDLSEYGARSLTQ